MLKKILAPCLITAAALGVSSNANAEIETALANICDIVIADDKSELRKKIRNVRKEYSIQLKDYYDGITCGGKSLIKVAILNNSVEAGTLLIKKLPRKKLKEPEHDGEALTAWISSQGLGENAVAKVISERI